MNTSNFNISCLTASTPYTENIYVYAFEACDWRAVSNRRVPRFSSWDGPEKVDHSRFLRPTRLLRTGVRPACGQACHAFEACWPKQARSTLFFLGWPENMSFSVFWGRHAFYKKACDQTCNAKRSSNHCFREWTLPTLTYHVSLPLRHTRKMACG